MLLNNAGYIGACPIDFSSQAIVLQAAVTHGCPTEISELKHVKADIGFAAFLITVNDRSLNFI